MPDHAAPITADKPKYAKGILLIHGLLDSPCHMQSLAEYFKSRGFLVRTILLPGHGTRPGDLLHITLEDWKAITLYGIHSLLADAEHVYVAGQSTGANLALYYAYQGLPIKGLILFAPANKIKNRLAFLSQYHSLFNPKWLKTQWVKIALEIDYAKYQSFPYNAVYQVYRLTQELNTLKQQQQITMPLFMALTTDDEVVNAQTSIDFFKQQHHSSNRLLLFTNQIKQTLSPQITVLASTFPDDNIINFSHVCLAIKPDHYHYGKSCDYQKSLCTLFTRNKLMKPTTIYQGALNYQNLLRYRWLYRLTYNPYFTKLTEALDAFLWDVV